MQFIVYVLVAGALVACGPETRDATIRPISQLHQADLTLPPAPGPLVWHCTGSDLGGYYPTGCENRVFSLTCSQPICYTAHNATAQKRLDALAGMITLGGHPLNDTSRFPPFIVVHRFDCWITDDPDFSDPNTVYLMADLSRVAGSVEIDWTDIDTLRSAPWTILGGTTSKDWPSTGHCY